MKLPPPIGISVGDPAGVGPLISVRAALCVAPTERIVLYGDAGQLSELVDQEMAKKNGNVRKELRVFEANASLEALEQGQLGIVNVGRISKDLVAQHAPLAETGAFQLQTLARATDDALLGTLRALVTGPISKSAVTQSGVVFTGHTEYLAARAGLPEDSVTMMFLGPRLCTALVTTHLSIQHVPAAITEERVLRTSRHLAAALLRLATKDKKHAPKMVIAGLNPHAGEAGLLGSEEEHILLPAYRKLQQQAPFSTGEVDLVGIWPAETAFRKAAQKEIDGVVAMIHDQATIASKILDWQDAVNVTWGLPFVRTSVDHGVAYEAAALGVVSEAGMKVALAFARLLSQKL